MEKRKNRVLLSICIPTYNGASSSLGLVLNSVVYVANKYDDIEVIISDNCSLDGTKELIASYINNYPFIRYHRNAENLGFNANMLKTADMAKGDYAWMIGDDDIINIATFDAIYKKLQSDTIDYLSVRFTTAFKEDFLPNEEVLSNIMIKDGTYSDILYKNCFRGNTLSTFMGSSIFRLSAFRSVDTSFIKNSFDCYYNCFPNAYIIATAFHNARCSYITEPCIICVSSKYHIKGYENIKSWAIIDTKAIVELYQYVKALGVEQKYLKQTEARIVFDYVITGTKMKANKMPLPEHYYKYLLKAITNPVVLSCLLKKLSNVVFKTSFSLDI